MQSWSFGYVNAEGQFYRRTVEAATLDEAIDKMAEERPGVQIVSVTRSA